MAGTKRKHKQDEDQDVRNVDGSNGQHDTSQSSGSAENEPQPIVFYCGQCQVIVGDSTSWVNGDSDLGTITLAKMSKYVQKGSRLVTSHEGKDLGSTYITLQCDRCKTIIGRMYKTTPVQLDVMRDLFTFDVEKVDSYQLGGDDQTSAEVDHESLLSVPTAQFIFTQLRKMQSLIVNHNDRIRTLEVKISIPGASDVIMSDSAKKKTKLNLD